MPDWESIWRQQLPPWWARWLARGFGALARARRYAYRVGWLQQIQLPVPVIVVGNLTVGGTGKTPVVLFLAQALRAAGWHPVIISRGYGSRARQPTCVLPEADAVNVGDEPLLLAQRSACPVWVGTHRVAVARAALAAEPACDVLLSDDGLQHYALGRHLGLAVFDTARGIGNGYLLPAGCLREPLSQLARVDAVLCQGEGSIVGVTADFRFNLVGEVAYALLTPTIPVAVHTWQGKRVAALAGIGHPERFFAHLCALGVVCETYAFPDHHVFTPADLPCDADIIVMTEKDAVKCRAFADERCMVLPVNARFTPDLVAWVVARLR